MTYGKVGGSGATVMGAAVLPTTGGNRPLFFAAATLFVGGLVALVASSIAARKASKTEA